jgi:CheY-like chemotaxis protein
MDVFLSGIDGRVLLESLKAEEETKDVPVIMISAYPHIKESALKGGAEIFLEKPFTIDTLVKAINEVV